MDILSKFIELSKCRDIAGAIEFQRQLSNFSRGQAHRGKIERICGFDVSYDKKSNTNYAAAVVMSYPAMEIIERIHAINKAYFPYVPGLLAFREGLPIIRLFKSLKSAPDVLIFDGQGLAHPRRMGIATMMGILFDKPSIGAAKSRLIGEYIEPENTRGSISRLFSKGEVIGDVLRSRKDVKPIFVSVGHKISLQKATSIVLKCCNKYRIPEPIRAAHRFSNEIRLKQRV